MVGSLATGGCIWCVSRSLLTIACVGFALLPLAGCADVPRAFGPDQATANAHFDGFAESFERRFTNVVRDARFSAARLKLARHALTPSRLSRDTALWTATRSTPRGPEHELLLRGAFDGNSYRFSTMAAPPVPAAIGEARHLMRLRQVGDDDWQWRTQVEQSIGALPPSRAPLVMRAWFASAERPATAQRTDYQRAAPRTTSTLGRIARVDSIIAIPQPDSSTLVTLHVFVDATPLAQSHPAFTRFVRKYIEPSRWRMRLYDKSGEWFDVRAAQRAIVVRFRSRRGELQPLVGAARPLPDSLRVDVDALAKFGPWMVGVTGMTGDFVFVSTPTERAWAMRFAKPPEWHLPLIGEALLRSPLRRPFEGNGVVLRLGLRTAPSGATVVDRVVEGTVRESGVMRFLGSLGFTAMSDFAGAVEEEEARFLSEVARALRADVGP